MTDDDDTEQPALIVNGFRIGASPDDPAHVLVQFSASRDGPHFSLLLDASILDQLSAAFKDAAQKIRKRAS